MTNKFLDDILLNEGTDFQKFGKRCACLYSPITWGFVDGITNGMGGYFNSFLIAGAHGAMSRLEAKDKLSVGRDITIPVLATYGSYLFGRLFGMLVNNYKNR